MNSKEIQKLIDRVVGTDGTLRIPSWWMHKILSDLVKYCKENAGTSVTIVDYIESQLNLVVDKIVDLNERLQDVESHELLEFVSELPSEPKENIIYLVPSLNGEGTNVLTEWAYINNTWEQFGEFKADIDLTPYLKIEDLPFEKGDANNSAVLKGEYQGYKNKAISQTSMAIGAATTAGLKGWYYSAIDFTNKKITLSDKPTYILVGTTLINGGWGSGTPNIKVDDVISLVNNSKYDLCSKVTAVKGNVITVDNLPFTKLLIDSGTSLAVLAGQFSDGYSVYIPERPDAGIIDFGGGAFSEGSLSKATNIASHAEGLQTHAYGQYSHTEGRETEAGYAAHAEGRETKAIGESSHTEGLRTKTIDIAGHAEGADTIAGQKAHAEGSLCEASGYASHAEGGSSKSMAQYSHAEGKECEAQANNSHAEGSGSKAVDQAAHAEGVRTEAGYVAHSEGYETKALGRYSHSEGGATSALGQYSHAEGNATYVGTEDKEVPSAVNTTELGYSAHAEGQSTVAIGNSSHAEGLKTKTAALGAHAEGGATSALSQYSHAEGYRTISNNSAEHASGKFNKSTQSSDASQATHFSIGIGTSETDRKNAVEVKLNGDTYIIGIGEYNGTNYDKATDLARYLTKLETRIKELEDIIEQITEKV